MTVKRKDFQKASAFINEFLLKLSEQDECAELRDSLNLALLHMQRYYRKLRLRSQSRSPSRTLGSSLRDHSPMTPFRDTPDKFALKWINLDSPRVTASLPLEGSDAIETLPLMIQAAKHGDEELMLQLVEKDPESVDCADCFGRTPLMYAAHFNKLDALKLLLDNEANVDMRAHDGVTVMHHLCRAGLDEALELVIGQGADVSIVDDFGRSAIHWSVCTESLDCLKLLLSNGAKVHTADADGLTPSMWACRLDHIHHFELLTTAEQEGSDDGEAMELDNNGRTWMHWAVRKKEPLECLTTLLTDDTARLKDNEGKTVLLTAAEQGSLDACKAIIGIAGNSILNDTDNQNRTALHLAAICGHGEVLNYLLELGADPDIKDKSEATPWDYAKTRQLHYCMLIMNAHQRFRNKHENNEERGRKSSKEKMPTPTISVSPHPPGRPTPKNRPPSAPPGGRATNEPEEQMTREVSSAGNERKQAELQDSVEVEATEAFTKCNENETAVASKSIVIPNGEGRESENENKEKDEPHSEDHHSFSGMDVSDIENEDQSNQLESPQNEEHPLKLTPSPPPRRRPLPPTTLSHHEEYVDGPQEASPAPPQPALRKNSPIVGDTPKMLPPGSALMPLQRPLGAVEPLQEPTKKKKKKKKLQQQNAMDLAASMNHGYAAPLPPAGGGGYVGPVHPPPLNHVGGGVPLSPPNGGYAGPLHPPAPNGGGYAAPMPPPINVRVPSPRPMGNRFDERPSWPPEPSRPGAPVPPNSSRDLSPPAPPGGMQRLHKMGSEDNLAAIDHQGASSPENELSGNGNNGNGFHNNNHHNNNKLNRYPPPQLHGPLAREQAKNLLGNRKEAKKGPPPLNNLSPMSRKKLPNSTSLPSPMGQSLAPPVGQSHKPSYGRNSNTPPSIHPTSSGGRNANYLM